MKKIVLIFLLSFAVCANAQFTKVLETPISAAAKIPANKVQLGTTYDVEEINELISHYYTFRSGDEIKILNLESMEIEFTMSLTGVIDTSFYDTYLSFYKNFYKSDKSWTCFVMPYSATTGEYGLQIYSAGKLTQTGITSTSRMPPYAAKTKDKLFLLTRSKDALLYI